MTDKYKLSTGEFRTYGVRPFYELTGMYTSNAFSGNYLRKA